MTPFGFRVVPEVVPDVPADGVDLVDGKGQLEALVEDRQQHISPYRHRGPADRDRVGFDVELVVELAEDLFDRVLARDHARDRSEFVHHDRGVDPLLREGGQQGRDIEDLADDHRLLDDLAHRRVAGKVALVP